MGDLVQHAHFAERVGAVEIVLAQKPDLARVEAIETAHRADAPLIGNRHRHGRKRRPIS